MYSMSMWCVCVYVAWMVVRQLSVVQYTPTRIWSSLNMVRICFHAKRWRHHLGKIDAWKKVRRSFITWELGAFACMCVCVWQHLSRPVYISIKILLSDVSFYGYMHKCVYLLNLSQNEHCSLGSPSHNSHFGVWDSANVFFFVFVSPLARDFYLLVKCSPK